jgi:4-amino-4-deoxy-L-arabinose transferase-like glycosyltransferase
MEDRIKAGENMAESSGIQVPDNDPLRAVATFPLSRPTILSKLGWTVFVVIGFAATYVIKVEMPDVPGWVFWPILVGVLIVELCVIAWLGVIGMSLRFDSQELVYGPVWARKRLPF